VAFAADVAGDLIALVKRTRATLRSAELGFFGVVVYTRVHTPRFWGDARQRRNLGLLRRNAPRLRIN